MGFLFPLAVQNPGPVIVGMLEKVAVDWLLSWE